MLASILWPLGIGIYLGVMLLIAAVLLWVAFFILAQPFVAVAGIRRAIRRYQEENAAAQRSARTLTRSE